MMSAMKQTPSLRRQGSMFFNSLIGDSPMVKIAFTSIDIYCEMAFIINTGEQMR